MNKYLLYTFFGLMIISAVSCINELDREAEGVDKILVVEGSVSTAKGPHTVKITKSAKFASIIQDAVELQSNATVSVRDETGEVELLTEIKEGVYSTSADYQAEVGKTYTLQITLANGERYISTPEEILPVPQIDSLIPSWVERPATDEFNVVSGMEIFASWQDPGDEKNFYIWDANGTYHIETRPDLYVEVGPWGASPMPKDCCESCYVSEKDLTFINILKDDNTNGIANFHNVVFIPDDGRRISDRYMVAVQQKSISKEAYQFFTVLLNQLKINGDIFDPPPGIVRSNMINLDNPDDRVIGYFYVSDVAYDTIYVNQEDLIKPKSDNVLNDDCRVLNRGETISVTQRPGWWKDR